MEKMMKHFRFKKKRKERIKMRIKLNKIDKELLKRYINKEVKYKDIKDNLSFRKTSFYKIVNEIKEQRISI